MKNNRKNRNVRLKKSVTFDISSKLIMLHLSNLATIIHKKSAQPQTPNLDEYQCYTLHTVTKTHAFLYKTRHITILMFGGREEKYNYTIH
jgi:hypothetical protein